MKDQAVFNYKLAADSQVEIAIFNFQGQVIKTFSNGFWPAGSHTQSLDISDLDQGVYIYPEK